MQDVLDNIRIFMEDDSQNPTNLESIYEMVDRTNPSSPGDVLTLGIIVGSWHAFNRDKFEESTVNVDFDSLNPKDCYDKDKFLKNMYNNKDDY